MLLIGEVAKRKVEIFTAGCPACQETIDLINSMACSTCDVIIQDMNDSTVSQRAKSLGIHRVPAVVIDDVLVDCCAAPAPDEASLRSAGIGQQI